MREPVRSYSIRHVFPPRAVLALIFCAAVALPGYAELFVGHIPVQSVTGGEASVIDMSRFVELDPGWTIHADPTRDVEVSFNAEAMSLKLLISPSRAGLVEIPLDFRDGAGRRKASTLLTAAVARRERYRFRYKPSDKSVKAVVAGSFNGWSQSRTPLTDPDGDGVYEAEAMLDPGTYLYKFVVGGKWISDPENPNKSEDGFGGFNSIATVAGPAGGAPPYLYADKITATEAEIRIVESGNPAENISVVIQKRDGAASAGKFTRSEGVIRVPMRAVPKGAWVRIIVADAGGRVSNAVRIRRPEPETGRGAAADFSWQDAVLYFAFTDRFHNGDRGNDSPVVAEGLLPQGNFHGGDWKGIREKLAEGYFDSIGVNVLWISPVNENPPDAYREFTPPYRLYTGYHGYWPISATRVDPHGGGAEDLKALISAAHARGMKVIADLVVNHVHDSHPFWKAHPEWFAPRLLPDGRENLRLWDEHPFTTWFDRFLPTIDYENEEVTKVMIDNSEWWAREFDLDGFRLDAVKHVPPAFWKKFRSRLRATLEKDGRRLFLVGETFMSREGIMSFVGPGMLDGQFDFPLYDSLKSVFAQRHSGFADLEASLAASERVYGKESIMSPLVGNHDKSRFMAYADGDLPDPKEPDEEEVGWVRPPRVNMPANYDRLSMALAFIMSIDGAPMIYYGDEYGMSGAGDPDNRRDMRFGQRMSRDEKNILATFSRLTRIRSAHPALRYGHRRPVLVEKDRYAFVRAYLDDRVVAAFNRTDRPADFDLAVSPELPDGDYTESISGAAVTVSGGKMKLTIGPRSPAIIVSGKASPGAAVSGSAPAPSAPPAVPFKTAGMAGTFNDWNVNDPGYRLEYKSESARWELTRQFQKGRYTFKFVTDGGWDLHRGVSDAGLLEQPGKDIPLEIGFNGYYKVTLSWQDNRWSIGRASPPSATADIRGPATVTPGHDAVFDASASQARDGRTIGSYTWTQVEPATPVLEGLPRTTASPKLTLRPSKQGLYRIMLSVDDGAPGVNKEIEFAARSSYQAVTAPSGDVIAFEPVPSGKLRALLQVAAAEAISLRLTENFDTGRFLGAKEPARTDAELPARYTLTQGGKPIDLSPRRSGVIELLFDSSSGKLSVRRSTLTRFRFDPPSSAGAVEDVAVAGTFNGWDKSKNPMVRLPSGTYELYADIPEGLHRYKYVVNGKAWIPDPLSSAELSEPDGHGGVNSGIFVGDRGSDFGPAEPNRIVTGALRHDPADIDDFNMVTERTAMVRLRVREGDALSVVLIARFPNAPVKRMAMNKLSSKLGFDYYGANISLPSTDKPLEYIFELTDGTALVYHTPTANKQGLRGVDQTTQWFKQSLIPAFLTPDWAKNVVWYQIMLDRWRNGDPANDPDGSLPWRWDWYKPATPGETPNLYGGAGVWNRNFGGDLKGLIWSLDYLEDIGVTGIYLNPMFEAPGHHKYNTADYRHIDDNFGERGDVARAQAAEGADSSAWQFTPTDKLFLSFIEEAHRRGFKVILDGVFNHSGTDFWAFRDLVKNTKQSPYKDWYVVKQWDVAPARAGEPTFTYDGWAGFSGLPEYAENDKGLLPGIRRHIFDITARWMDPNGDGDPSDGIDGWRLDVPENVNERFWVDWRKLVKGVNPNAYISGEIWENAAHRLRGRHYDAVMNYEFTKRVYGFFLPGGSTPALSADAFGSALEEMTGWYLPQVNPVMQNLLSSHDVDRVSSAIHNRAGWKRGRIQDDNPAYDPGPPSAADYETLKRIVAFQMTWTGAPMIYYGDEAGMFGADDPTNRMPMWWRDLMPYDNPAYEVHADVLEHHRRMIAIRNTFPALRSGDARVIWTDRGGDAMAFERRLGTQRVIVVIRRGDKPVSAAIAVGKSPAGFVDVADPLNTEMSTGAVSGIGSTRRAVRIRPGAPQIRSQNGVLPVTLKDRSWAILAGVK